MQPKFRLMESGAGVGGCGNQKISKDDVISKFKDDGDFDRLRVKIIRKLKENEELRNSIVSMVKQSAALNRPGTENMKPRQLSDAIHQEVGDKVMNQISDGIWEIIRSGDDMKTEIKETVQSVYSRLLNPEGTEGGEPSSNSDTMAVQNRPNNNEPVTASTNDIDGTFSDSEPNEPPGFALSDLHQNNHEEQLKEELPLHIPQDKLPTGKEKQEAHHSQDVLETDSLNATTPTAVSTVMEQKQPCDGSDEDPDVPPGFG